MTYKTAYTPFTPNNSEQRLHLLYYRGCWHRISRCLILPRFLGLGQKKFTILRPSSFTRCSGSGFPPLTKIPHRYPPEGFGPYLNPTVADHPLRPATDHWLGRPLPYQQPILPQAALLAFYNFPISGICGITSRFQVYPTLKGTFLRVTHPFATKK